MKICMIGGTGLLGSQGAAELISRGHQVKAIALPPLPQGAVLPPEMEIEYGNYLEMNDDEIKKMFEGCEGFIFAAGVDERVEGPAPIYNLYKKYNIDPVKRLLKIAKECGVKHCVILGSYFSYFAKARPQMHLTEYHPYIRSRIDQEKVAMSFAYDNFNVAVLELPYIFGTQPGRKPVWIFLVESIRKMPGVTIEASPRLVLKGGHGATNVSVRVGITVSVQRLTRSLLRSGSRSTMMTSFVNIRKKLMNSI